MPYADHQKATCHPERRRKTADGRCDTCYRRDRYRTDEAAREQRRVSSRRWHRKVSGLPADGVRDDSP